MEYKLIPLPIGIVCHIFVCYCPRTRYGGVCVPPRALNPKLRCSGFSAALCGRPHHPLDHRREQHENDGEVSEPLEDVVGAGLFFAGALQAQMIRNDTYDGAPGEISLAWQQIVAEVLGEKAKERVNQAGQDANPGGEKVQRSTPPRLAHQHEWERQIDERGSPHGTGFAPIETRMSQENGDPTDEQAKEAKRVLGRASKAQLGTASASHQEMKTGMCRSVSLMVIV